LRASEATSIDSVRSRQSALGTAVPKGMEVTGGERKLFEEELLNV
jgi:hypothetical protein